MFFWPCLRNAGPIVNPSTGSVTRMPMTPPSARVVPSRKTLRGISFGSSEARAGRATEDGRGRLPGLGRFSGSTFAGFSARRDSRATSLSQRKPNRTAMIAPTATIDQLTTNPTRRTTAPIASPTGHRLGPGTCGWSWLGSSSRT